MQLNPNDLFSQIGLIADNDPPPKPYEVYLEI